MALASNHILTIGAPDVAAGSADIFIIHCSYYLVVTQRVYPELELRLAWLFSSVSSDATWQEAAQAFPTLNNGAAFPSSHGQATSFFQESGDVQLQVAFIPDDFSASESP